MKRVIWTPLALDSLKEVVDFLETKWSDQIVEKFLRQVDYRIEQIQENPELAPSIENTLFRLLLIHKTTSLFYRNHPDHIKVLLVWDNRQNPAKLLKKLKASND